jgi:hypothetical protein
MRGSLLISRGLRGPIKTGGGSGLMRPASLIMGTVPYKIRNHQSNIIMVSTPALAPNHTSL